MRTMSTSVALGELLAVAAMPVAAVVAMVAAILARRRPGLARILGVTAILLAVGMITAGRRLSEPMNTARHAQRERFAPLKIGLPRSEVETRLGEPDLICPGEGLHPHKARATEELRQRLFAATRERWIYFLPVTGATGEPHPSDCKPLYGDGEVGFNEAGEVIYFIELTDETFLTF